MKHSFEQQDINWSVLSLALSLSLSLYSPVCTSEAAICTDSNNIGSGVDLVLYPSQPAAGWLSALVFKSWGIVQGLVMPPRVAPMQVVVVPIPNSKLSRDESQALLDKTEEFVQQLRAAGIRRNEIPATFTRPAGNTPTGRLR